jgi:hypothetical protein
VVQAVCRRNLTAEARGRSQVTPYEIVVMLEEALGQGFLQLIYVFPSSAILANDQNTFLFTRCSDKKEYQFSFVNPVAFDRKII